MVTPPLHCAGCSNAWQPHGALRGWSTTASCQVRYNALVWTHTQQGVPTEVNLHPHFDMRQDAYFVGPAMSTWAKRALGFSLLWLQHEALPCCPCDNLLAFQINSLPLSETRINLRQSLTTDKGKQWNILWFQVLSVSWIQTLKFTGQTSASPPHNQVQLSTALLENRGYCEVWKEYQMENCK